MGAPALAAAVAGLPAAEAARLADEAEALAFADWFAAAGPLRSRLGLRVERAAGACLLVAPGLPSPMFNRVIGLGLGRAATEADVQALVAAYRAAGCANWWLHWNPHAAPAELVSRLAGLGFTQPARRSWAKALRGSEPAPDVHTSLRIELAADPDEAARTIVEAFEMPAFMTDWLRCLYGRPGWRFYTASDNGTVAGAGCLFVSGQLAWLGMGCMAASHRGRGGQRALMARRIGDAIAAGCRYIVTETGEPIADEPNPSLANIARCGFVTVASRLNFAGPAAA